MILGSTHEARWGLADQEYILILEKMLLCCVPGTADHTSCPTRANHRGQSHQCGHAIDSPQARASSHWYEHDAFLQGPSTSAKGTNPYEIPISRLLISVQVSRSIKYYSNEDTNDSETYALYTLFGKFWISNALSWWTERQLSQHMQITRYMNLVLWYFRLFPAYLFSHDGMFLFGMLSTWDEPYISVMVDW